MKCHAFVRENVPKSVKYDKNGGLSYILYSLCIEVDHRQPYLSVYHFAFKIAMTINTCPALTFRNICTSCSYQLWFIETIIQGEYD